MADRRCWVDLHVHSQYSNKTRQWFFRKLGAQESYTPPERVYTLAKARGMTFVTITDHDVIGGALEIAHHKDAFVSEEVTTHFPNDLSNIHVVTLNISEAQHVDITRCRANIYDLVVYLSEQRITHYLAHPLFASGAPITVEKLEKLLLLFKNMEILNGSRILKQQDLVAGVVRRLTPVLVDELANKYGIQPTGPDPHLKSFVGGSDDHAGLAVARAYTVAPPAKTIDAFLQAIDSGETTVEGEPGTAVSLANAIYLIGYEVFRRQPGSDKSGNNVYSTLFDGLRAAATPVILQPIAALRRKRASTDQNKLTLPELIQQEAIAVWKERPPFQLTQLLKTSQKEETQRQIFEWINAVTNRIMKRYGPELTNSLFSFDLMKKFETLGALTSAHLMLLPYYLSFRHQTGDRALLEAVGQRFGITPPVEENIQKVAVFSDSIHDVNGAALSLRALAEVAAAVGKRMTLIGASEQPTGATGPLMNFEAVWTMPIPEYEEMRLAVPPILELLDYCDREAFTSFLIASPGPVGLAGLLVARLLNRPAIGYYHTDIPEFVRHITEDASAGEVARMYVHWFYNRTDRILVPSENARMSLTAHGFDATRLHMLPNGIDSVRFHPSKRDPGIWPRLGINGGEKLLYVGRLSREKNLATLADSFNNLLQGPGAPSLVIVGDGPYRQELQTMFNGHSVHFTGYLDGDELATVYASSDLFVFPSTTDTSGNVVLEAQASGLPVIVSDQGGSQENMIDGRTGIVAPAGNPDSFSQAIQVLLDNPARRKDMGRAARVFIEEEGARTYQAVLDELMALCP